MKHTKIGVAASTFAAASFVFLGCGQDPAPVEPLDDPIKPPMEEEMMPPEEPMEPEDPNAVWDEPEEPEVEPEEPELEEDVDIDALLQPEPPEEPTN